MEDYEELMLQISDVMREANRVRPELSHEQAIKNIRGIVERHGEWLPVTTRGETWDVKCSLCGEENDLETDYCPCCGAKMKNCINLDSE